MIEIITITSLIIIIYIYWGYGQFLNILRKYFAKTKIKNTTINLINLPSVTVLLPVHNEVDFVVKRLENIISCEYPKDKIKILVVSDGSNDETDEKVLSLNNKLISYKS